jgi:hypothetical protein
LKRVIVGLLFILIGGGVLSWGSRATSKLSASKNWPTVRGTVVSSKVVEDSTFGRGGKSNVIYHTDVSYRFSVNGETYESNVFSLGAPKSFVDRSDAEKVLAAYAVRREVTVYHEPGNPVRSSLEVGAVPQDFGLMTLSSGMFLLIGLMLFMSGALGWARSELVGR